MAATYVLKRTADGQYMFNLKAANGEIILTSERYIQKANAEIGIQAVRLNSPLDARYGRRTSSSGQHYFVLKAANGEVIGTSETYTMATAMEQGITSVKENGPKAPVEDLT